MTTSTVMRSCFFALANVNCVLQPCTGIARLKRWKRAHRIDLDPPIEVLAVLLKEMDKDSKVELQRSQVDELLNSNAKMDAA